MAKPRVTKEALRALAGLTGLQLTDERLEELLPRVQQSAESLAKLDALDLQSAEPSIVFRAQRH